MRNYHYIRFLTILLSNLIVLNAFSIGPDKRVIRTKLFFGTAILKQGIYPLLDESLPGYQIGLGYEYHLSHTFLMFESDPSIHNNAIKSESFRNTRLVIPVLLNAEFGNNYFFSLGLGFTPSILLGQNFSNNDEVTTKLFSLGPVFKIEGGIKVWHNFSALISASLLGGGSKYYSMIGSTINPPERTLMVDSNFYLSFGIAYKL
jgi:hypothetical protein